MLVDSFDLTGGGVDFNLFVGAEVVVVVCKLLFEIEFKNELAPSVDAKGDAAAAAAADVASYLFELIEWDFFIRGRGKDLYEIFSLT